jgi:hypothetical protein
MTGPKKPAADGFLAEIERAGLQTRIWAFLEEASVEDMRALIAEMTKVSNSTTPQITRVLEVVAHGNAALEAMRKQYAPREIDGPDTSDPGYRAHSFWPGD